MNLDQIRIEASWAQEVLRGRSAIARYPGCAMEINCRASLKNSVECAQKIVHILSLTDSAISDGRGDAVPTVLPDWFIEQFKPLPTKLEADEWLSRWQRANAEEKSKMSRKNWNFEGWLYWLLPENRQWLIKSLSWTSTHVQFQLAVEGLPVPLGALEVLVAFCASPEVSDFLVDI